MMKAMHACCRKLKQSRLCKPAVAPTTSWRVSVKIWCASSQIFCPHMYSLQIILFTYLFFLTATWP